MPTIGFLRLAPYLVGSADADLTPGSVKESSSTTCSPSFRAPTTRRLGWATRYSYNPRIARIDTINFDGVIKHDADPAAP